MEIRADIRDDLAAELGPRRAAEYLAGKAEAILTLAAHAGAGTLDDYLKLPAIRRKPPSRRTAREGVLTAMLEAGEEITPEVLRSLRTFRG